MSSTTSTPTLALAGELTIQQAADQHRVLLDALAARGDTAGSWTLDLGAIEACDSAGVQLLLAARQSLAALGAELQLERMTAPVREVLLTYGLGPDLQPIQAGERA
jgi:phospholipid transport system transporter-binding protein